MDDDDSDKKGVYFYTHTHNANISYDSCFCLQLKVLDVVLSVCMDDSNSSMGKYQYPESAKIHQVI